MLSGWFFLCGGVGTYYFKDINNGKNEHSICLDEEGGRKQELPEFYFKCFKALQYKKSFSFNSYHWAEEYFYRSQCMIFAYA
jgi:hypothetical protein